MHDTFKIHPLYRSVRHQPLARPLTIKVANPLLRRFAFKTKIRQRFYFGHWSQKKIFILERHETIEPELLVQLADALKVPLKLSRISTRTRLSITFRTTTKDLTITVRMAPINARSITSTNTEMRSRRTSAWQKKTRSCTTRYSKRRAKRSLC